MKRRDFLAAGMGAIGAASSPIAFFSSADAGAATGTFSPDLDPIPGDPREVRFHLKPVMTNILHTDVWEGPCRWEAKSLQKEKAEAERRFAAWSEEIAKTKLKDPNAAFLAPAHLTHSEDFIVRPEQLAKLQPDSQQTDAYYIAPHASSLSAFVIGKQFGKPIVFKDFSGRGADVAPYARANGCEAFVPDSDEELEQLVSALRARKVFQSTKVLFPTERGYPAACALSGSMDIDDLEKRLGIAVRKISYKELAEQMGRMMADKPQIREAQSFADQLLKTARGSYIQREHVVQSVQFYQTIRSLMSRRGCNAFTIECFEFCASRLPASWKITPCLIHALLRNLDCASSCEADLGSLLAMRMLMSVSRRSCHQGNWCRHGADAFSVNHSAPSMKMNGYDQPDLPYQLGRFVSQGWGAKVVIDFMNNPEKTVTAARVNTTGTKVLVIRGALAGASGWGKDLIGCSIQAVIKPPEGTLGDCLRKRVEYGNHQQWVYGDWTRQMRQLAQTLGLEADVIS